MAEIEKNTGAQIIETKYIKITNSPSLKLPMRSVEDYMKPKPDQFTPLQRDELVKSELSKDYASEPFFYFLKHSRHQNYEEIPKLELIRALDDYKKNYDINYKDYKGSLSNIEEGTPEKIYEFPVQGEVNKLPIHPDISLRTNDTARLNSNKPEITITSYKPILKSDVSSEDRRPLFEPPLSDSKPDDEKWEEFVPDTYKRFSTEYQPESSRLDIARFHSLPDRFEGSKLSRANVRAALIEEDAQADIYQVNAEMVPDTEISANPCEVLISSHQKSKAVSMGNKAGFVKYILNTIPLD